MATKPLDYQTYNTILEQADRLVRKTNGLTRVDALHAFMKTYPHDARYAAAAHRLRRRTAPARAAVTKVVPVRKAERGHTHLRGNSHAGRRPLPRRLGGHRLGRHGAVRVRPPRCVPGLRGGVPACERPARRAPGQSHGRAHAPPECHRHPDGPDHPAPGSGAGLSFVARVG